MNKYLPLAVLLAGCATQPHKIPTTVVAISQYQSADCATLASDLERVQTELYLLNGQQKKAATADVVWVSVGTFLFWPAYFGLLATNDRTDDIARLKGEQAAMTRVTDERC
jgi:hypothetical protein